MWKLNIHQDIHVQFVLILLIISFKVEELALLSTLRMNEKSDTDNITITQVIMISS